MREITLKLYRITELEQSIQDHILDNYKPTLDNSYLNSTSIEPVEDMKRMYGENYDINKPVIELFDIDKIDINNDHFDCSNNIRINDKQKFFEWLGLSQENIDKGIDIHLGLSNYYKITILALIATNKDIDSKILSDVEYSFHQHMKRIFQDLKTKIYCRKGKLEQLKCKEFTQKGILVDL